MSALHHVSVGPTAREHWAQLELALGEGDVLVLLDGATADLAAIAAWKRSLALELRCVIVACGPGSAACHRSDR